MARRCLLLVLLCCPAVPAAAQQVFESVGSRALGMGGAFVAVADDATAPYWNPAGLATGAPAGLTIGWVGFRTGDQQGPVAAGPTRRTSTFTSLGAWPIGISYGHATDTCLAQVGGSTQVVSLRTSQIGASILQTVVEGLVVGATLKYVRGTVAQGGAEGLTAGAALDRAGDSPGHTSGAFDLDLAAMIDVAPVRLGLTVRNARQPTFADAAGHEASLSRQIRAGAAYAPGPGLTLALDLDLHTVDLRNGPRRMLAVGGEKRLGTRVTVRGGLRWNLADDSGATPAVGGSIATSRHMWLDLHYTRGGVLADRGFGAALRAGF